MSHAGIAACGCHVSLTELILKIILPFHCFFFLPIFAHRSLISTLSTSTSSIEGETFTRIAKVFDIFVVAIGVLADRTWFRSSWVRGAIGARCNFLTMLYIGLSSLNWKTKHSYQSQPVRDNRLNVYQFMFSLNSNDAVILKSVKKTLSLRKVVKI